MTRPVLLLVSAAVVLAAAAAKPDSTERHHVLRPLEVMGVKQNADGGIAVEAVTRISGSEARRTGIHSSGGVSIVAPNFYIPSYGSRMTSSVYVRGLGARIDQPVVGLSVDNIPYLNKDNYDFDIADIESIDVLRGAQSVLNGRNTMGGQINIRTLSPLTTRGWRLSAEYGSANSVRAAAAYYGRLSPTLGMSLSAQYRHTDGFFTNQYDGKKIDRENSGSLRWKTSWQPSAALSLTNTAQFSIDRQGAYPYESLVTGTIAYNDTCAYRRSAFADGLTVAWAGKRVVVTSQTSLQYLDDRMDLDQDFLPDPYFTLMQAKREWAFTEDLFTRGSRGDYSWLGGVFAFYKHTSMDAPVHFKNKGIARLIEQKRNEMNPDYPIRWDSRNFVLGSDFGLASGGVAFYHESAFRLGAWRFEAGIRLDIERSKLNYHSHTNTGFSTMHVLPDGSEQVYSHTPVKIDDTGRLSKTFVELLPKVTVGWQGQTVNPYFTFSKAYKTGGFNTQMFSDVLQQRIMNMMGLSASYSLEDIVAYDPEHSFNYEAGAHIDLPAHGLKIDAAIFYIDCRNQQLTVFPPGTVTGRLMTNAGRTRSFGMEVSADWKPLSDLTFRASYGYTNATFRSYNDGRNDYRGKHLPYAPQNTLFLQGYWRVPQLEFYGITPSLTASARCAGKIYWNEANTLSNPFYCVPELAVEFAAERWSLRLWADNFTDTSYRTFYFLSMGNEFVQRGNPRRFGATVRVNIF